MCTWKCRCFLFTFYFQPTVNSSQCTTKWQEGNDPKKLSKILNIEEYKRHLSVEAYTGVPGRIINSLSSSGTRRGNYVKISGWYKCKSYSVIKHEQRNKDDITPTNGTHTHIRIYHPSLPLYLPADSISKTRIKVRVSWTGLINSEQELSLNYPNI